MTKVTMVETPKKISEPEISDQVKFTDKKGRTFVLKKPDLLDQYDLMRALGKDAEVQGCVTLATPLVCIKSIDGEDFPSPQSNLQIRAGLKRIGTETMTEILNALVKSNLISTESNQEEEKEELKK